MKLVIVIPFFNEEKLISDLLDSFLAQSCLEFELIFVDNFSTDKTVQIISQKLTALSLFKWHIITERQKGTGAAADTGFRYAIKKLEATHIARTDADCVPEKNWIQVITQTFNEQNYDFLAGKILPKKDENTSILDLIISPCLVSISAIYGKIVRQGSKFMYPYMLVAGNNMAISANLYLLAGGFPRSKIDDINEDDVLAENIRTITNKAKFIPQMKVYNSLRRLKKYGYYKTLMWYKDRAYKPKLENDIDIR